MNRVVPSLRLRTVGLVALFGFTTFFVQMVPDEVVSERPEALRPAAAQAAYCASEPTFSGYLSGAEPDPRRRADHGE